MNKFLRLLADIALLPVSGCIFPGNRDCADDWDGAEAPPQSNETKDRREKMTAMAREDAENHRSPTKLKKD